MQMCVGVVFSHVLGLYKIRNVICEDSMSVHK